MEDAQFTGLVAFDRWPVLKTAVVQGGEEWHPRRATGP